MHIVAMVHRGYICVKKMKSNDDFRRNSVDRELLLRKRHHRQAAAINVRQLCVSRPTITKYPDFDHASSKSG